MKFSTVLLLTTALTVGVGGIGISSGAIVETTVVSCMLPNGAAQDNSFAPNVSGNWQMSFTGERGNREATMQITQDCNKFRGSFQRERGSAPIVGSLNGNQISFTVKLPHWQLSFSGTVEGDKMSGTIKDGGSWSAKRQQ